jgi:C4-dicarboxylate transporter
VVQRLKTLFVLLAEENLVIIVRMEMSVLLEVIRGETGNASFYLFSQTVPNFFAELGFA